MLTVTNLTKTFKQIDQKTKQARIVGIQGLNFSVSAGRILGLVGPNGAGKTTTMRILSGLTQAHSGQVMLEGQDIATLSDYKKIASLISAETQAYERLTPREQLYLAYELAGLPEDEKQSKVDELATHLEMESFLDRPNQSFSSGMKQKINIARGLITNPHVVIFDEVTNGLDIFAAKAVKNQIQLLSQRNCYIIFSTHIMPDADELCEDIVVIHKGVVREQGDKWELFNKYKVKNTEELFFAVVTEE